MSYQRKRITFFVALDSLIVLCAIFFSFMLVYPSFSFEVFKNTSLIFTAGVLLASHHIFAAIYNLYNKAWSYASVNELLAITKAVTFSIVSTMAVQAIVLNTVYFRALAVTWMLHLLLIGGSRFSWRLVRDHYIKPKKNVKRH